MKCIIWTKYLYCFSFHVRRHCQDEDSNKTLKKLALRRSACRQCRIDQLTVTKNPESGFSSKIFSAEISKYCLSNLTLETGGFSSKGATSLLLLKSRHNTLSCMPVTKPYNSPRIYCLFYTFA